MKIWIVPFTSTLMSAVTALLTFTLPPEVQAQHKPPAQPDISLESASGASLGRGIGSSALYARQRVDYCVRNRGVESHETLKVEFSSKGLATRSGSIELVRGQLFAYQEALGAREVRCGSLDFEVHVDALVGLALFSDEAKSLVTLSDSNRRTVDSRPVRLRTPR